MPRVSKTNNSSKTIKPNNKAVTTENTVRLHKPLIDGVISCLDRIFNEKKQADKVLESIFKANKQWGARDRGFVAENTYEIVRWWRLLKYCVGFESQKIENSKDFKTILGAWLILKKQIDENQTEFIDLNIQQIRSNYDSAQEIRKIKESIPDWLDELGQEELAEKWEIELKELNKTSKVYLRVNELKTSKDVLINDLTKLGIEINTIEAVPSALELQKRTNVFATELFKNGHFEVQDAGSQLITEFLEIEPGMRVIDACAGAGGKSLHIASILKNKGKIIALDVEEWKLTELKKRAKRNGADTIETRLIESKVIKRLKEKADRLLLDVPCSGLGVLKRNPDSKWKLNPESIAEIKETQRKILKSYPSMLKVGGKMVYATCSILPSENQQQVKWFLKNNKAYKLVAEKTIYPSEHGFDGFYMALIEKKA
jgi:16S rRNA (cytosine967-C5)-methyltransferase